VILHGIEIPQGQLAAFCERYHIRKLSLFGSILTPDFGPESDIDVLVEFEPGRSPGFLGLARIQRELSALFGGRLVDLRTPPDLSPYFRDQVVASSIVQYAHR